jgi:hypothetical protein
MGLLHFFKIQGSKKEIIRNAVSPNIPNGMTEEEVEKYLEADDVYRRFCLYALPPSKDN